ncbi:LysR family transcriptional regulator [Idiomarina sp. MD25a]|uniref:LysR family transcriptional regulator n=1 Tax=Idiomarina sp. MD25a TaxID=1889913 RepID=UPI0008F86C57|nr:LysR family transcriptional regulator [Idiomarina sp. MD25a]OIN01725.1 LysR family transcriptional regulator [Idiomarina sp. MD25a]
MKQWQGISEFVAVAQTSSFTSAAKQLGLSVAQVSRNIAALEQRLKLPLLYRSTRSVSLTEEGLLYLPHCQHLVASLNDADQAIQQRSEKPQGLIRLTAPVFYGEHVIAPLVNDFLNQYPDCRLDFNLTNETLDLIEGHYDLAIRLGHLGTPRLKASPLGHRRHFLVGTPEYFARFGEPTDLASLADHRCLTGTLKSWRFQVDGKAKSVQPNALVHCNSGLAIKDAVCKGLGIAILPDYYVADELEAGVLQEVLTKYRQPDDGIWALYPESRHRIAKVRVLIDFLKLKLTDNG